MDATDSSETFFPNLTVSSQTTYYYFVELSGVKRETEYKLR
jgi:hypothetical protein